MKSFTTAIFVWLIFVNVSAAQAVSLTDSLENLIQVEQDAEKKCSLQLVLAFEYAITEPGKAETLLISVLDVAERNNWQDKMAEAYSTLGNVYDMNGKGLIATRYYLRSAEIYDQTGDEGSLASVYYNLGVLFSDREEWQKAIAYYGKALHIEQEARDTLNASHTLMSLAIAYRRNGQIPMAAELFSELARQIYRIEDDALKNGFYANYGNFLVAAQQDLETGKKYLDSALNMAVLLAHPLYLGGAHINMAEYWIAVGNGDSALYHARLGKQIADGTGYLYKQMNACMALSRSFEILPQPDSALFYLKKYMVMNDSLNSKAKSRQINELETIYETAEKEKKILEQDLRIHNYQIRIILAVAGAVLLGVVLLFLYGRFRSKRRNEVALSKKNAEIQKALEQREILLKEIHHRVKNNLQLISSLLNLQAISQSGENRELFREANQRVKSMALIHQQLYEQDDMTAVDLFTYMQDLVKSLEKAFGKNNEENFLHLHIPAGIHLDIDQLIPFALVMNEVIVNAFKYGADQAGVLHLDITVETTADRWLSVRVKDSGVGFDPGAARKGFGLTLIGALVEKLRGTYQYDKENGTLFVLTFEMAPL